MHNLCMFVSGALPMLYASHECLESGQLMSSVHECNNSQAAKNEV